MKMQKQKELIPKEEELLRIFVGQENLRNNDYARGLMIENLRKCDPDEQSQKLYKMFDIYIEYLKPIDINLTLLPRKRQKEFILALIDKEGDKDAYREEMEKLLTELGKEKETTKKELDEAQSELATFNKNMEVFKDNRSEGVGISCTIEEFEVTVAGDPNPQKKYRVHYTISDAFLGEDRTNSVVVDDPTDFSVTRTKDNYVNNEREGLLIDKGKNLESKIRKTGHELDRIKLAESGTQTCIDSHDYTLETMDEVTANKKGAVITKIRNELRAMTLPKEYANTSENL
jgi:hypothetical protein